jgi:serine/threonine-protein kinase
MKHAKTTPEPPSVRSGKSVTPALEALLLRCLAKVPSERPDDAGALLHELETCTAEGTWTAVDAGAWWRTADKLAPHPAPMPAAGVETGQNRDSTAPEATMAYETSSRSN